jgi:hypothetical protein
MCDFISIVKLVEVNLFTMYGKPSKRFSSKHFSIFINLVGKKMSMFYFSLNGENKTIIEYVKSSTHRQTICFIPLIQQLFLWAL